MSNSSNYDKFSMIWFSYGKTFGCFRNQVEKRIFPKLFFFVKKEIKLKTQT